VIEKKKAHLVRLDTRLHSDAPHAFDGQKHVVGVAGGGECSGDHLHVVVRRVSERQARVRVVLEQRIEQFSKPVIGIPEVRTTCQYVCEIE
jgi:hypothetical protein